MTNTRQGIIKKIENNPKLADSYKFMLAAVSLDGCLLQLASDALRDNKALVMRAVTQHGYSLRYASPRLQYNKKICIAAVQNYGCALRFVNIELRHQPELVLAAHERCWHALDYVHDMPLSESLICKILKVNKHAVAAISKEMLHNPAILNMVSAEKLSHLELR